MYPSSHLRVKEWVHLPLAHVRREELQEGHQKARHVPGQVGEHGVYLTLAGGEVGG